MANAGLRDEEKIKEGIKRADFVRRGMLTLHMGWPLARQRREIAKPNKAADNPNKTYRDRGAVSLVYPSTNQPIYSRSIYHRTRIEPSRTTLHPTHPLHMHKQHTHTHFYIYIYVHTHMYAFNHTSIAFLNTAGIVCQFVPSLSSSPNHQYRQDNAQCPPPPDTDSAGQAMTAPARPTCNNEHKHEYSLPYKHGQVVRKCRPLLISPPPSFHSSVF